MHLYKIMMKTSRILLSRCVTVHPSTTLIQGRGVGVLADHSSSSSTSSAAQQKQRHCLTRRRSLLGAVRASVGDVGERRPATTTTELLQSSLHQLRYFSDQTTTDNDHITFTSATPTLNDVIRKLESETLPWREESSLALLEQAQTLLQDAQRQIQASTAATADPTPEERAFWEDCRVVIFKCWLQRLDDLWEAWNSSIESSSDKNNISPASLQRQRQRQLARDLCHAAAAAHVALEELYPHLAAPEQQQTLTLLWSSSSSSGAGGVSVEGSDNDSLSFSKEQLGARKRGCEAVLQGWARASQAAHGHDNRLKAVAAGIPQRAQFLLERMTATASSLSSASGSGSTTVEAAAAPTTAHYNAVLEAWAYSHEHLRGVLAEQLFRQQLVIVGSTKQALSSSSRLPDADSYRWILRAWSWSSDRRAAAMATRHLKAMLRHLEESEDASFEPTLEDYHAVLKAWGHAKTRMTAVAAHAVLHQMTKSTSQGLTHVEPDLTCYSYVLQAAAADGNRLRTHPEEQRYQQNLGQTVVEPVLEEMEQALIIPDATCYAAAIQTWKNCALAHQTASESSEECVRRIMQLLSEFRLSHQRSAAVGQSSKGVLVSTMNHVFEAMALSTHERRAERAEILLSEMEAALEESPDGGAQSTIKSKLRKQLPKPNTDSYRHVINIWKSMPVKQKLPRAKAILMRMKDNYLKRSSNEKLSPAEAREAVKVLNTFIHLCASQKVKHDVEREVVLREALTAVEAMKTGRGIQPDATTYTALLEAATNLMPTRGEVAGQRARQFNLVDQVFRLACEDGMVDDQLLQKLLSITTEDQYARLVVSASHTDLEGNKTVPEEWTRNALSYGKGERGGRGRILALDGRRTIPLGVDGRKKVTRSMQDFKMRRLRDKRNQSLLRGGRWDRKDDVIADSFAA